MDRMIYYKPGKSEDGFVLDESNGTHRYPEKQEKQESESDARSQQDRNAK